jgi:hypothetical protein
VYVRDRVGSLARRSIRDDHRAAGDCIATGGERKLDHHLWRCLDRGALLLVATFHRRQPIHRVRLFVIIDHSVMRRAKENEVCERVPVEFRLVRVVPRAPGTLGADVTYLAEQRRGIRMNQRLGALGKCAHVSRDREELLQRRFRRPPHQEVSYPSRGVGRPGPPDHRHLSHSHAVPGHRVVQRNSGAEPD